MTPRLRVGVLGCGGIARRHLAACRQLAQEGVADLAPVAFADRHLDRAQRLAHEFAGTSGRAYTDHRALLADAALDLLIVTLPPGSHGTEVADAAAAGVHLLLEKPLALTSADAWAMVDAVERAGVRAQVGFGYRFGAAVSAFRRLRDSGDLGSVGMFDARYLCNSLHAHWWRHKEVSGGQLLEQVIHHVDLLRYLMGEPEWVYASLASQFHQHVTDYTIEDAGVALTRGPGDRLGSLHWSNAAIPGRWDKAFTVIAERATLHAQDHNTATLFWTREPVRIEDLTGPDRALADQLADLVAAIESGSETRTPIREGARTLDLALAMLEADRLKTPVQVVTR
ncbi:Gfo/Idh/MocA family protein [Raineyella fluvialis]|uniref:Gfo/Idh/MocA family oxidoreductase n=1 Tax=Raineyella fluvialis TaxID=2662261 RepID=A0A5Q2FJQ1_9ACTN|nr:Gfo/Idh/MocA family oxidoreductase [Raineyella fluvialis]QGF24556.1 gfo/Idh/MocA family oxidoreductase [Raineyella fluvialis]